MFINLSNLSFNLNKQDTKEVVSAIAHLIDKTSELFNKHGPGSQTDSISSVELSEFERPLSLKTAYSQGHILVEVAADQLMAFTRTLEEPIQTIAPFTCARSVLESCALANWLIDNNITPLERVKRSFAFRFEGMEQQRKLINSADSEDGQNKFEKRTGDVVKTAKKLGLEIFMDKKDKVVGIGVRMPSTTSLTKRILDKEFDYRLLSSVTHAHHFALAQTSFAKHSDSEDEEVSLFEKTLSPIFILYLCNLTSEVFIKAVENLTRLHGSYNDQYEELFNKTRSKLTKYSQIINS